MDYGGGRFCNHESWILGQAMVYVIQGPLLNHMVRIILPLRSPESHEKWIIKEQTNKNEV